MPMVTIRKVRPLRVTLRDLFQQEARLVARESALQRALEQQPVRQGGHQQRAHVAGRGEIARVPQRVRAGGRHQRQHRAGRGAALDLGVGARRPREAHRVLGHRGIHPHLIGRGLQRLEIGGGGHGLHGQQRL
jgi:hypothetical protein